MTSAQITWTKHLYFRGANMTKRLMTLTSQLPSRSSPKRTVVKKKTQINLYELIFSISLLWE